ncbi:hypothetical protein FRB90_012423, partial [Tulasnella sp. 427]
MLFFGTLASSQSKERRRDLGVSRIGILALIIVACAATVNAAPAEMRAKAPLPAIHHLRSAGATFIPPQAPAQIPTKEDVARPSVADADARVEDDD